MLLCLLILKRCNIIKKTKKITKKEITTKRVIELKELTFLELIKKVKYFLILKENIYLKLTLEM